MKNPQSSFYLSNINIIKLYLDAWVAPTQEKGWEVSQLQDTSLCPSSCGKPSTRVGRDRTVTGPVPNPSSCTYPLHHSSVKTLSYSQACKIFWPKSPTQQIRCPVKFLSLQPSPANKKCLCNHTSPRSCASSTCTHLLFFFCFPLLPP